MKVMLFVSILLGVLYIYQPINPDNLSGNLLYSGPRTDGEALLPEADHMIFHFANAEKTLIKINRVEDVIFFGSSTKVLYVEELESENFGVVLYDLTTENREVIYEISNIVKINGCIFGLELAYVDDKHFSIGNRQDETIVLVDIDTKEGTVIAKDVFDSHSWYGGTILYYARMEGIYAYNTETGENKYIVEGGSPRVSFDGKMLTYSNGGVYVRNLETGKEWRYMYYSAEDFCMSPDSQYVALFENWKGIVPRKCHTIRIWDYKNYSTYKVVPVFSGYWDGIDWGE